MIVAQQQRYNAQRAAAKGARDFRQALISKVKSPGLRGTRSLAKGDSIVIIDLERAEIYGGQLTEEGRAIYGNAKGMRSDPINRFKRFQILRAGKSGDRIVVNHMFSGSEASVEGRIAGIDFENSKLKVLLPDGHVINIDPSSADFNSIVITPEDPPGKWWWPFSRK